MLGHDTSIALKPLKNMKITRGGGDKGDGYR